MDDVRLRRAQLGTPVSWEDQAMTNPIAAGGERRVHKAKLTQGIYPTRYFPQGVSHPMANMPVDRRKGVDRRVALRKRRMLDYLANDFADHAEVVSEIVMAVRFPPIAIHPPAMDELEIQWGTMFIMDDCVDASKLDMGKILQAAVEAEGR